MTGSGEAVSAKIIDGQGGPSEITEERIKEFQAVLKALVGIQIGVLRIPGAALVGFEPSQIGTVVGVIMDACIPQLDLITEDKEILGKVGLKRHAGSLKDREGYPDYDHASGLRAELKLLYVDPVEVKMKKPTTPREPSARLTQKVTLKNVEPDKDVLLVIAYQLQPDKKEPKLYVPTIIDVGAFSMIECIKARDKRLTDAGGKWFGNYETPAVLSKAGREALRKGLEIENNYGRKESEGKHYNEDTNFGKLKRIPYPPLQEFLKSCGVDRGTAGEEVEGAPNAQE